MRIKYVGVLAAAVCLSVAGCSGKDEPKVDAGGEATPVAAAVTESPVSSASTALVVVDASVAAEGKVISDQELKGSSGKMRRQVEIVFANVAREQLVTALTTSLTSAGFTAGRAKEAENDLTVNFKKGEEIIGITLSQPKRKESAEIAGASVKATITRRL
ncbi:hypothetical protein [Stenotrophomonas sp. UBA7606]|uniref:hypothetical protein n=1 Tax=Stenotrophomonas sp. UBA7606 TaxID=1947559 RepID=UPI0025CD5640|nr:hypothetical protein [Stenotrophomonas sp. UBA7606]